MNTGLLSKRLQTEHLPKPAEIERISRSIAKEKGNPEYYISPAAWSQIKRGTTPSIYKLFSLAVCLRMPYERVVQAFGVDLERAGSNGFGPDRAELVRINLQELGFSLNEIRDLLALRIKSVDTCDRVRERAEAKVADIEKKIKSLQHMKEALSELVGACSRRGKTRECPILDSLEANGWFQHHIGGRDG